MAGHVTGRAVARQPLAAGVAVDLDGDADVHDEHQHARRDDGGDGVDARDQLPVAEVAGHRRHADGHAFDGAHREHADGERVEGERHGRHDDHRDDGAPARAQLVAAQRQEDDDPTLARQPDDAPHTEEAAHVGAVLRQLAPAVPVEQLDAHPAEPDDGERDEKAVADGRQEGEVDGRALARQVRRAHIDEERRRVRHDADDHDGGNRVRVELDHEPIQRHVAVVQQARHVDVVRRENVVDGQRVG